MALNSKRMQTFFNEFLITTTDFLNKFTADCERKFMEFEEKLYRIDSDLKIIEAQLASVPVEEPALQTSDLQPPVPFAEIPQVPATSAPEPEQKNDPLPVQEVSSNLIKISESATYKKFFKMVKVGIPIGAVKLDMENKFGLDGNLLDNPELLIDKSPEDYEQVEE